MDILVKAAAIAVAGAILGLAVRKNAPEVAIMMTLAILCLLIYLSAGVFRQLVDFVEEMGRLAHVQAPSVGIVLKVVGISILTKIAAVVCQEAGHQATASGVELVGCLSALYIAIPLFETAMDMVMSFC